MPRSIFKNAIVVPVFFLVALFVVSGTPVFAQNTPIDRAAGGLDTTAGAGGWSPNATPSNKINDIIASIIKTLLGLTGVIFLALMIFAGNLWMTAGGNEDQVGKARALMVNAVIGIIVVFAAYIVTNYVVETIAVIVTS